jgi:hypothetical protein
MSCLGDSQDRRPTRERGLTSQPPLIPGAMLGQDEHVRHRCSPLKALDDIVGATLPVEGLNTSRATGVRERLTQRCRLAFRFLLIGVQQVIRQRDRGIDGNVERRHQEHPG